MSVPKFIRRNQWTTELEKVWIQTLMRIATRLLVSLVRILSASLAVVPAGRRRARPLAAPSGSRWRSRRRRHRSSRGRLCRKAAGEALDPTVEDTYWRDSYASRPYVKKGSAYSDYQPAYRYGWEAAANPDYRHRQFTNVEPELERNSTTYRGPLQTEWRDVRDATRDSYERIRNRMQ